MKPPYEITSEILHLISSISEKIGEVKSARLVKPPTKLRKKNRIKTIHSSLEIEGNTLTVEQITDLINNKKVVAPRKDILEVKNAIKVYENLYQFDVFDIKSLYFAHKMLMSGLIKNAGKIRNTGVGIIKGKEVKHIAPPDAMVYPLLKDLFAYLKNDKDIFLIKSCVFHYEFEFIHPFTDGNGRMGRLWQTMILKEYSSIFEFLPVESLIKQRQQEYYDILGRCDNQGKSTLFIEFMLEIINSSLEDLLQNQRVAVNQQNRVESFKDIINKDLFSRKDYMRHNKDISSATASRDLKNAVENGVLIKTGNKRLTQYRFK